MGPIPEAAKAALNDFFKRDVAIRATAPLKDGVEIALFVDDAGPLCLTKKDGRPQINDTTPKRPDLTFWATTKGIEDLCKEKTEDIGEIGVMILKLMASSDPALRLKVKVHIGGFDLFRNGYLGVLPLGGTTVMKFLASKGLTGIGKIKDAISSLRG